MAGRMNMPAERTCGAPGKGRYIEVRTRALEPGGRVRTFTDVTDYLSTLEALRQSEARWRSLTDLSSDWYWEQDDAVSFCAAGRQCPYHTDRRAR